MATLHPYASRAVPFEPDAGAVEHRQREAVLRARELDRQAKREEMRAHGRRLDEIEDAYYERRTGRSRIKR